MGDSAAITLMTDFGDYDAYAGIMKGVIFSINPDARVFDVCHNIPSYNITSASYVLWSYYKWYPAGTVHCVVVDPGVGGARNAIAVEFDGHKFVLPDNGLISMTIAGREDECEVRRIENTDLFLHPVSATFHGRDIFAPVAAHLAKGMPIEETGPSISLTEAGVSVAVRVSDGRARGTIVHVDRFGNYVSNITADLLKRFSGKTILTRIGGFTIIGLSDTFSDAPTGELVAYVGSTGLLEVGVTKGSARDTLKLVVGADVEVRVR